MTNHELGVELWHASHADPGIVDAMIAIANCDGYGIDRKVAALMAVSKDKESMEIVVDELPNRHCGDGLHARMATQRLQMAVAACRRLLA